MRHQIKWTGPDAECLTRRMLLLGSGKKVPQPRYRRHAALGRLTNYLSQRTEHENDRLAKGLF